MVRRRFIWLQCRAAILQQGGVRHWSSADGRTTEQWQCARHAVSERCTPIHQHKRNARLRARERGCVLLGNARTKYEAIFEFGEWRWGTVSRLFDEPSDLSARRRRNWMQEGENVTTYSRLDGLHSLLSASIPPNGARDKTPAAIIFL